jgi:hypothetical protein
MQNENYFIKYVLEIAIELAAAAKLVNSYEIKHKYGAFSRGDGLIIQIH